MIVTEAHEEAARKLLDEDDACHLTCCEDDDLLMCGVDGTDEPWMSDEEPIGCAACIEADEADICPKTKAKCPYPPVED